MRTRSKTDHIRRKAKQYKRLLCSVIKGLVARRDTVGEFLFEHNKNEI